MLRDDHARNEFEDFSGPLGGSAFEQLCADRTLGRCIARTDGIVIVVSNLDGLELLAERPQGKAKHEQLCRDEGVPVTTRERR
jgi:hypothetical protein